MVNTSNRGPLGCVTNLGEIDKGTNCLNPSPQQGVVGAQLLAARPFSVWDSSTWWWFETKIRRSSPVRWLVELKAFFDNLGWWMIGSPAFGAANGDLSFGPGDEETEYMKDTPAYQEAREIYREWVQSGRPNGKFRIKGTACEWVPAKGYFYVAGRTGAGKTESPRGHWSEPLRYPLWGYTGNFSIRFTEAGWPSDGYVLVQLENYTSLPSYLHGIDEGNDFLDSLYTKSPGWPIVSTSRQVYRFRDYIPTDIVKGQVQPAPNPQPVSSADSSHKVVVGDSLSKIAKEYYGDMMLWPILFDRNQKIIGSDPDKIKVGQILVVPAKEKLTAAQIQDAKQRAQPLPPAGPLYVAPPR